MSPVEKTLVACEGGPCGGLGLLVELPIPLEVERDGGGLYVLDERGDEDEPHFVYVWVDPA